MNLYRLGSIQSSHCNRVYEYIRTCCDLHTHLPISPIYSIPGGPPFAGEGFCSEAFLIFMAPCENDEFSDVVCSNSVVARPQYVRVGRNVVKTSKNPSKSSHDLEKS